MALTKAQVREILSTAGVDGEHMSEAVNRIIEGHSASIEALREDVSALKAENAALKTDAEKLAGVQKELDGLKEQMAADAKSREGKDYDKLKKEFDDYKAGQELKETRAAKTAAFREILKDAEIDGKYMDKIIKYTDIDGIELDEKGKVKDAKARMKAVSEEWPEYKVTKGQIGADTPKPPANNGNAGKSKEDILKITDYAERQKAIEDNHELFGF